MVVVVNAHTDDVKTNPQLYSHSGFTQTVKYCISGLSSTCKD